MAWPERKRLCCFFIPPNSLFPPFCSVICRNELKKINKNEKIEDTVQQNIEIKNKLRRNKKKKRENLASSQYCNNCIVLFLLQLEKYGISINFKGKNGKKKIITH